MELDVRNALGRVRRFGGDVDGPGCMRYPRLLNRVASRPLASEAKLCREAEICYATMCLVTDYDVWHETEETVTIEMIIENVQKNIQSAKAVIKKAIASLPPWEQARCGCSEALGNCIVTQTDKITKEAQERLRHIIGKYI